MNEQFERTSMLIGELALNKLRQSHVLVVGLGGVGGYVAEALARSGIGQLTLVDNDTYSVSNLNRQIGALHSTIGKKKTDVMQSRILDINPTCKIDAKCIQYNATTREIVFNNTYDYVVDAIDLVTHKLDLIETCINRSIPVISSMGTGNKLNADNFYIADISKTSGCPLSRIMRKELRARGILHLPVLYSPDLPLTPVTSATDDSGRRSIPGSVSWVPSIAGLKIAGYVIKELIK